ncbi:hypothetical protein ACM26V_09920 [Salipaludibacillus sp. HK11]|uniref:hypothetical protein n=1 Tax=Salipaludibacillus sp. HK11 TaxID=3394320 RepID=UPI0039FCE1E3
MRLFLLCIGFIMAVAGGISLVAYLNLLTVGFTLLEYSIFLLQRVETYFFIIGAAIVIAIVYTPVSRKRLTKSGKK